LTLIWRGIESVFVSLFIQRNPASIGSNAPVLGTAQTPKAPLTILWTTDSPAQEAALSGARQATVNI
jgi:hypothetical protein